MKNESCTIWAKRATQLIIVFAILLFLLGLGGCVSTPRLTAEERRSDVEFLARWAKDYHPCVEVNSKVAGMPDYEKLLPKYMDLAEQAETNEAFLQVLWGYYTLIGASGHAYLLDELQLLDYMIDSLRYDAKGLSDIPWRRFWEARYWAKLQKKGFSHAPFRIIRQGDDYFTGEDWSFWWKHIPAGSQIVRVNGMSCSEYKDYLKRQTALRYVAGDADMFAEQWLVMSEGPDFKGWQVSFRLPNGRTCDSFVPKRKGPPRNIKKTKFKNWRKGNCECVELSDEVGYVRIKAMMPLGRWQKSDEKKIRRFLEKSQGRYKKLIIDLRHNRGGDSRYTYDTLIRPFLDEPLVYKQISGIKRKAHAELFVVRGTCSFEAWETAVDGVPPPEGFDANVWDFFEIHREVKPSERYAFDGDVVVLMDQKSGSATETYLDAVKRTGIATLVGQRSAGALGGFIIAPVVRLPASGMIFRMEGDLDINPDGSFLELTGVQPDVELPVAGLPKAITREELLKDECVRVIIDEL